MAGPTASTFDEGAIGRVWWTLRVTFGLVPIVAGLDKFTNVLTRWDMYLARHSRT
jgi:hypothetical protein